MIRGEVEKPDTNYIYLIGDFDGNKLNAVKLGRSRKVTQRLRALNSATYRELRLMSCFPAEVSEEYKLHDMFKGSRYATTEWFEPSAEIFNAFGIIDIDRIHAEHDVYVDLLIADLLWQRSNYLAEGPVCTAAGGPYKDIYAFTRSRYINRAPDDGRVYCQKIERVFKSSGLDSVEYMLIHTLHEPIHIDLDSTIQWLRGNVLSECMGVEYADRVSAVLNGFRAKEGERLIKVNEARLKEEELCA